MSLGGKAPTSNREHINGRSIRCDPLVDPADASYSCCVKRRRWSNRKSLFFLALALCVLFGLCWALAVNAYRDVVREAFEERSLAYVQAFASSSLPWIDPIQPTMLEAAARFLLVGSAHYVQILVADELVIEERTALATDWELPLPDSPAPSTLKTTHVDQRAVLDVIVPLPRSAAAPSGAVRIGIDLAAVHLRVRSVSLWAGVVALGLATSILAVFAWVQRKRMMLGDRAETRTPELGHEGALSIGQLEIDPTVRQVRFQGHLVRLTPKQYALVACLAREPGRVYSDHDIVDEVWQTSAYADSKDVKQYVYLVRQRLSAIDPAGKHVIETVPGFGYRLLPDPIDQELTAS